MQNEFSVEIGKEEELFTLVHHNIAMALETENLALNPELVQKGVQAVLEDSNKGFYLVVKHMHQIAGSLMITQEWSDWRNAWIWWIQSVYVKPDYRGKGVYKTLFETVKKLASENKVPVIRLYVDQNNTSAMQVYAKTGMTASHYALWEWEE